MSSHERFHRELEKLINRYSMENGSNTPDFILAKYLMVCLVAFEHATYEREDWYGRTPKIASQTEKKERDAK